jgi:hypothetical protein
MKSPVTVYKISIPIQKTNDPQTRTNTYMIGSAAFIRLDKNKPNWHRQLQVFLFSLYEIYYALYHHKLADRYLWNFVKSSKNIFISPFYFPLSPLAFVLGVLMEWLRCNSCGGEWEGDCLAVSMSRQHICVLWARAPRPLPCGYSGVWYDLRSR